MKTKNKTFKKVGAIALCIGLLASIGIGAYLSDTEVKKDVYTVGNVQAEIVSNGDMELNNVGALLPGTVHQYERAAMNTGINDAYVFMSITIPYEMIGVADDDGTQLGEKTMQIFIPGSADSYVSSEWKLVDSGFIGQYEIEENEQLNGEHDNFSTVVGNTITYVYGYIGDNADGSLKALASGETTANLVETMKLTNLYRADNITGEVSTKLYAIQSNHVNGGLTDVNGVWAVINHALVGTENEVQTVNALMVGELFNAYIPNDVSSVEFVAMPQTYGLRSATAPEGAFDVSAAQDGSVMAWSEDGVFYVAAMNGEKIIANKNSDKMFYEKTNLTYINTENLDMSQVESAAHMFKRCANLTNDISDFNLTNVKNIEETFNGCNWLTEYTVPNSVEVIGVAAFANCSNLMSITIPNSVEAIGRWAFQRTGLTSVVIPENVKTIAYGTFMMSDNLTHVTLSEGLTEIGEAAFGMCENLQSITIPASVEKIDIMAFNSCSNLTSVTFEDGSQLKEIGDSAFSGCGLTTITIPEGVTSIGGYAFYCDDLTAINVDPANENYCSVDGVLFTKDMKTLIQYPCQSHISSTTYTIPNGVENISPLAIRGLYNYIDIPASVKNISEDAFVDLSAEAINVDPANEYYTSVDGVLYTKDMKTLIKYSSLSSNTEYTVPTGVEYINNHAFEGCMYLTSLTISDGVKTIGDYAFYNCYELTSMTVPSTVTYIGSMAFVSALAEDGYIPWFVDELYSHYYNNELFIIGNVLIDASAVSGEFIIPEGITQIYEYAFYGNTNVTSIVIPTSVKYIDYGAFYYTMIETVNFRGTEEQWNAIIETSENWNYGIMTEYTVNFNYVPVN